MDYKEVKRVIEAYPHDDFYIPFWYPNWPEGYQCNKKYVLDNIEAILVKIEIGADDLIQFKRQYDGLIRQAYQIAKRGN